MKLHKTVTLSLLASSMLMANTPLMQKALDAGLKPIPNDAKALQKMIDPKGTISDKKVALGKQLFFEPRLSKSGLISCNTCHNLGMGGVDGVSAAVGHKWTANPHHLNSPTVYNAVFASAQFWNGRSPDLEDQAQGPMQAAPEMAAPPALVEARVNSMKAYVDAFQDAYGKEVKIDFKTITATIGIFERTLVTPAPLDAFLQGDANALSAAEKEGLKVFIDKGCVSCHSGVALGGTMQPFPVAGAYKYASVGDFKGDKNGMVKTPTLRNIAQTAPYFHNGAIWTLTEAVQEMGRTQLGMEINKEDTAKIVTFLKSLNGDKGNISYPQLPTSSATTPKPDFN